MSKRLFTSESVTEGHPDKLCDQISDRILDEIISQDKDARVAVECCATTGLVFIMGEITTSCNPDVKNIARNTIKDIGYDSSDLGFDYKTCAVLVALDEQSSDISLGVSDSVEHRTSRNDYDLIGAGDQGIMFGYACNETKELMPMPITLAHGLTKRLTDVRKQGILDYLRPDGKAQVTVEYENDIPVRVDAVVVSTQHNEVVSIDTLRKDVLKHVIKEVIPANLMDDKTKIFINPTGRFVTGGPHGDSGLTGRKIIVDTYGGYCTHGGGSFSGKDPTKVDRSASYMARYVCKNVVAAGLADKCQLDLGYAIGVANPVAVYINTFGTGKIDDEKLLGVIKKVFDFRPRAIIDKLNLREPVYQKTTNYGHFGKSGLPWEKTDMAEKLKAEVSRLAD